MANPSQQIFHFHLHSNRGDRSSTTGEKKQSTVMWLKKLNEFQTIPFRSYLFVRKSKVLFSESLLQHPFMCVYKFKLFLFSAANAICQFLIMFLVDRKTKMLWLGELSKLIGWKWCCTRSRVCLSITRVCLTVRARRFYISHSADRLGSFVTFRYAMCSLFPHTNSTLDTSTKRRTQRMPQPSIQHMKHVVAAILHTRWPFGNAISFHKLLCT